MVSEPVAPRPLASTASTPVSSPAPRSPVPALHQLPTSLTADLRPTGHGPCRWSASIPPLRPVQPPPPSLASKEVRPQLQCLPVRLPAGEAHRPAPPSSSSAPLDSRHIFPEPVLSMDNHGKSYADFRKEVNEVLARHESNFDQIHATLQIILTEIQALRLDKTSGYINSFGREGAPPRPVCPPSLHQTNRLTTAPSPSSLPSRPLPSSSSSPSPLYANVTTNKATNTSPQLLHIRIPLAFERLDAMLYICNFDSVDSLWNSFEAIQAACTGLRKKRKLISLAALSPNLLTELGDQENMAGIRRGGIG